MSSLNLLGEEIVRINTANGWNVITPSDWESRANVEDWEFHIPHFRDGEYNQEDSGGKHWRQFAAHKATGQVKIGCGATAEAARADLEETIRISVDTYRIPAILSLIHSEVSEALEAFRVNDKANFVEELADVLIRVLDCSVGLGLDMDDAVARKLEKNKGRGYRHGGKRL